MDEFIHKYMHFLEANHYSLTSRRKWRGMLFSFSRWLFDHAIKTPEQITEEIMVFYQTHLKESIDRFGKKRSTESQRKNLTVIRAFLDYLKNQNVILTNPAQDLRLPRVHKSLPRQILTEEEAELVLSQPDVKTALGLRDRAMMELLYATGMRRMEIANLQLPEIDFKEKVIEIRESKGAKDRLVPVSDRALDWLDKYLEDARPKLAGSQSKNFVFLNCHRRPFSLTNLTTVFKKHFVACELAHLGACHVFRHTLATRLLEGGVDLRLIQEMLGHTDIKVTQVYTRVSIRKLQEVHQRTHPAKLKGMSKRYWAEKEEEKVKEKNGGLNE